MIVRRFSVGILKNPQLLRGISVRGYKASDNFYDDSNDEENKYIAQEYDESFKSSNKHALESSRKHQQEQEKLIRVAIIGVPNAGKSTLINSLAEHRICPVSRKVHTTRTFSRAITIRDNTQIVFFDTPGLVKDREIKKHHLEKTFLSAYRHSIQNADLVAVLHDVSNSFTRNALDSTVLEALTQYPKVPSVLVLNKIDCLKSKRLLLDLVRTLTNGSLNGVPFGKKPEKKRRVSVEEILDKMKDQEKQTDPDVERPKQKVNGYSNFSQIFMVSALKGDGVSKLMNYLCAQSKPKPWLFDADTYTDRTPEDLIVQSVKAKLLDFLPQEIPYQLNCQMEYYSVDKGQIFASVLVTCPTPRIEKLVCGVGNGKLKQITESVTSDLIETFEAPISLTISTLSYNKNKD